VSKEIYKIVEIDGNKIYVADDDGNRLPIFFKPYQLKLVGKVERYKQPELEEQVERPKKPVERGIQDIIRLRDR